MKRSQTLAGISLGAIFLALGQYVLYGALEVYLGFSQSKLSLWDLARLVRVFPYLGLCLQVFGGAVLVYAILKAYPSRTQARRVVSTVSTVGLVLVLFVSFSMVTIPSVKADLIGTGHYHLDLPLPISDAYVGLLDNSTYFLLDGSNWELMSVSSDRNAILNYALDLVDSGSIWTSGFPFDYSVNIPEGKSIVENYAGHSRTYISLYDSSGSPFTLTTNGTFYFVTDSRGRFLPSFCTSSATQSFNNVTDYLTSWGGKLLIGEGEFKRSGSDQFILKNHVDIEGSGSGTVFRNEDDAIGALFYCYNETSEAPTGFTIKGLTLDGHREHAENSTHGIYVFGTPQVTYEDIWFTYCEESGLYLHGIDLDVCDESIIRDNFFMFCRKAGLEIDYSNDLSITNNLFRQNGGYSYNGSSWIVGEGAGAYVDSTHFTSFIGNKYLTNSRGVVLLDSFLNSFSGDMARFNMGSGFELNASNYNDFSACVFDVNGVSMVSANYSGVYLNSSSVNSFSSCSFSDWLNGTQRYGIYSDLVGWANRSVGGTAFGNSVSAHNLVGWLDEWAHGSPP